MKSIKISPQNTEKIGQRRTPQRDAIVAYITESKDHPTADEIYQALKQKFPSLSIATVYNTLDLLVKANRIIAIGNLNGHSLRYDGNTKPHINLACINCHKVTDVIADNLKNNAEIISKNTGFKITGVKIVYTGLCPECQTKINN